MSEKPALNYYQQLKTPEWKKFSVSLKEESGWKCEHCGKPQGDVELTIHHTYYVSNMRLWEYPRCLLMCLCQPCHLKRQEIEQRIYINVADVLRDKTNAELLDQPIHAFFTAGFTLSDTK